MALSLTLRPLSVPLRLSGNKARNKKKREREKKRKHKLAAELVELRKGNSPEKKHKPVKSPASDTLVGRDQAWLTSRHDAKGKHTGRASKEAHWSAQFTRCMVSTFVKLLSARARVALSGWQPVTVRKKRTTPLSTLQLTRETRQIVVKFGK